MSAIEKLLRLGAYADRNHPHLFLNDYWALRALVNSVVEFAQRYRDDLKGQRVIDFGAGSSPYAPHFEAVGAEVMPADIGAYDPKVLRISDDGHVPVEDNSIGGVISTQVLEHVPEVQAYLREALRMLRPGGVFLLSTHGAWIYHPIPTDFRRWTEDGLIYECEQAGFKIEKVKLAVGVLAFTTHLRTTLIGGLLRRIPIIGLIRLPLYFVSNIIMWFEGLITPSFIMKANPELIIIFARKPAS